MPSLRRRGGRLLLLSALLPFSSGLLGAPHSPPPPPPTLGAPTPALAPAPAPTPAPVPPPVPTPAPASGQPPPPPGGGSQPPPPPGGGGPPPPPSMGTPPGPAGVGPPPPPGIPAPPLPPAPPGGFSPPPPTPPAPSLPPVASPPPPAPLPPAPPGGYSPPPPSPPPSPGPPPAPSPPAPPSPSPPSPTPPLPPSPSPSPSPSPPPPPSPPPSPPSPPPPPDAYTAHLGGLTNVAYGALGAASSYASPAVAAAVAAPLRQGAELATTFAAACGPLGAPFASAAAGDAQPYYQADLGAPAAISDVQVWTAVGYESYLAPISVYVTARPSLAGQQPCFSYNDTVPAISVQHGCARVGRYITLVLTGDNWAAPGQRVLRLCALKAFGAFLTPPPPLPPPPPPQPSPRPPPPQPPFPALSPYVDKGWVVIVATVCSVFGFVLCCFLVYWYLVYVRLRRRRREEEAMKLNLKSAVNSWYSRNQLPVPTMSWPDAARAPGSKPGNPGALVGLTTPSSPRYVTGFSPAPAEA